MATIVNADEIYRKLSSQVSEQFPEFMRDDAPKFIAFLKAYFEYLEQTQKAGDATRGLFDYMDIDRTLDDFVEHFRREFLINIPTNIQADKRLLTKYIRDFYRARGSEQGYRFLFRAMFDEEIDFYYPGDDILRASDGRWAQETVIRGLLSSGTAENFGGKQITGQTSGATARVQEVLVIEASGLELIQLVVENVRGTFQENETITDSSGDTIMIFNSVGSISDAIVTYGGAWHQVGDSILLTGSSGGSATGTITATTANSAVTFKITKGGSGYRLNGNTIITITGGSPARPARLRLLNLSNTTTSNTNIDIINTIKNVVISANPFAVGNPAFAAGNRNTVISSLFTFQNITTGSANTLGLLDAGAGYTGELPTVTIIDSEISSRNTADGTYGGYSGRNGQIIASRAPGAISRISISTSTINFLKNDPISIVNTTRSAANTTDTNVDTVTSITRGLRRQGTYDATVTADIKGTFALPGRYTDTKGFLSWNNKLQDNDYYQEYSYVIRTMRSLSEYAHILKRTTHPAGTKLFGMVKAYSGANMYSSHVGSAVETFYRRHSNNVIKITSGKTVTLTKPPNWLNDGTLHANSGGIAGSNLMIIPVSNVSSSNGFYQINAISSSTVMSIRIPFESGALTNAYFYYSTGYKGTI